MRGARIGITAARRAAEQAALVTALGGVPCHGPSVDIDRPVPDAELLRTVVDVIADPPDVVVLVTGVGARHLLGAAERAGSLRALVAALGRTRLVVRGGKPRRVLRQHGIAPDVVAHPAESAVVRDLLLAEGVRGRRVLVQCAGGAPDVMTRPLRAAGARVREVHPYALTLPPDARAAAALAREAARGGLAAITFTSAHAVHGFVAVAEREGVDADDLVAAGTLVASVGPVTGAALREHGVPVHVQPATPRMGAMYQELAAALAAVPR